MKRRRSFWLSGVVVVLLVAVAIVLWHTRGPTAQQQRALREIPGVWAASEEDGEEPDESVFVFDTNRAFTAQYTDNGKPVVVGGRWDVGWDRWNFNPSVTVLLNPQGETGAGRLDMYYERKKLVVLAGRPVYLEKKADAWPKVTRSFPPIIAVDWDDAKHLSPGMSVAEAATTVHQPIHVDEEYDYVVLFYWERRTNYELVLKLSEDKTMIEDISSGPWNSSGLLPPVVITDTNYSTPYFSFKSDFDWSNRTPVVFLDHLQEEPLDIFWVESQVAFDWVREEHMPYLIAQLTNARPCRMVMPLTSSRLPATWTTSDGSSVPEHSTVGREAAYLIEGFRVGTYPPWGYGSKGWDHVGPWSLEACHPKDEEIERIKVWWKHYEETGDRATDYCPISLPSPHRQPDWL